MSGRVQYIGIPTQVDVRNYRDHDDCKACKEQFNSNLYPDSSIQEDCPECFPKRRKGTVYIAVSHASPLITEFYEHPSGVMAEIAGRNTLIELSLEDFLSKFKRQIDILDDDTTFEDHLREVMDGSKAEAMKVERVIPEIIHKNWDNLSRREKQVAGVIAMSAIDIIDKLKTDFENQRKRIIVPRSEGQDNRQTGVPEAEQTDVH